MSLYGVFLVDQAKPLPHTLADIQVDEDFNFTELERILLSYSERYIWYYCNEKSLVKKRKKKSDQSSVYLDQGQDEPGRHEVR